MGTVYLAKNRMMDRPEVLKVISRSLLDRPGALERFQQETRSAAKLAHPNIVAAYSVLRPGELLVFAMEYVRGQDLAEVVNARGYLPVANAAFYIHQVANGLQHAFEKGMVHRDIKPNNLMLAIDGKKHVVKILDFGLAKATSEKEAGTGLTKIGQMLGTPDYVAPEQTLDAHQADIRADIYSLGCTLYFLLSGGPPFQETSLYGILEAHHKRDPRPLNLVRPDVPVELAAVVGKMMAKDRTKRYQTPIEVAKALVPFFKPGQTVAAPAPTSLGQTQSVAETQDPTNTATPAQLVPPPLPTPVFVVPPPVPVAGATPIPTAEPAWPLHVPIDTSRPVTQPRHRLRSLPPWRQRALVFVSGAALVVLLGVLLVRTSRGTVEIELSNPKANVSVTVDGNRIDIAGLEKPLSLEVGEHELKVKGDGFETITRQFTVTRGKNGPMTVRLVPRPGAADEKSLGPASKGFVSLFNGRNLDGWKTHPSQPGNWRVENGLLVGSGPSTSHLYSERGDFTSFHLRVEAQINDRGNGGVYCRSSVGPKWPSDEPRFLDGYEAQIDSNGAVSSKTGSLLAPGVAVVDNPSSPVPAGQWFTIELIGADNHIVVKVNGQTTAHYVDTDRLFPMGHIALQQRDPETVVKFRKIEIRETQSGDGGSTHPDASKRFACEIYNPGIARWSIEGNELVQTSLVGPIGILFGDPNWEDLDFSADAMRIEGNEIGGLNFCFQDIDNHEAFAVGEHQNTQYAIDSFENGNCTPTATRQGLLTNGQWYRLEVRLRGKSTECFLDGKLVLNCDRVGNVRGRVGLGTNKSAYRYRNILVKSPDGKILLEGLPDADGALERQGEHNALNGTSWDIVMRRDAPAEDYRRALRLAEAACRIKPEDGNYLNTLGVAQYRAGRLAEALATLNRSIMLNVVDDGPEPVDVAFLALTHHDLGNVDSAKAFLEQLRELAKKPRWSTNTEAQALLREADEKLSDLTQEEGVPIAANGWTPLFNGKDLTGWYEPKENKGTWRVVDGVLIGRGGGPGGTPAQLATTRDGLKDFKLRVEVVPRVGASSVLLRSPAQDQDSAGKGVRVALTTGTAISNEQVNAGAIHEVGVRNWGLRGNAQSVGLPRESYVVEIHVSGRQITTFVEGTKVAQYDDDKDLYSSGQIRLAVRADSDAGFRRIELALPKEQPPAAKRFRCQLDERFRRDWSIADDELVNDSTEQWGRIVFGDTISGDYDFSVDVKKVAGNDVVVLGFARDGIESGFFYGLGAWTNTRHDTGYGRDGNLDYFGDCVGALEQGRWYHAEVRIRGNTCECYLDNERLFTFTADGLNNGKMALSSNKSVYRFRNITVKSPDGKVLLEGLPDLDHATEPQ